MRLSTQIFTLFAGLLLTFSTAYSQTEVQVYTLAEIDSVWPHYQFSMKIPLHTTDSITLSPLYRLVFQGIIEWSEAPNLSWDNFILVSADETGSNIGQRSRKSL